jgi:transmembrane sensor
MSQSDFNGWNGARGARRVGITLLAAIALVSSVSGDRPAHPRDWMLLRVAFGHTERLPLGDGRTVDLNTDSQIHVRLTDSQTQVVMDRGEALFAGVSPRSLRVTANEAVLTSRNAVFSLRVRERGRTDIIVAEGTVDAGRTGRLLADWAERALPAASDSTALAPGEAASLDAAGLYGKRTLPLETLTHKLAWKDHWLWFSDETLAEAVERFNSYNTEQLVIADPRLNTMSLGGRFRPTEPDSFVASLQRVFDVRVVRIAASSAGRQLVYLDGRCAGSSAHIGKLRRCDTAMVQ